MINSTSSTAESIQKSNTLIVISIQKNTHPNPKCAVVQELRFFLLKKKICFSEIRNAFYHIWWFFYKIQGDFVKWSLLKENKTSFLMDRLLSPNLAQIATKGLRIDILTSDFILNAMFYSQWSKHYTHITKLVTFSLSV